MTRVRLDEWIERGVAAHRAGDYEKALRAYRAALRLAPRDAEALSLTGLALCHAGRLDEAEAPLRRAIEQEPEQIGFRFNLVDYLERARRFDAAADEVERILALDPKNLRAIEKRGDFALASNRLDVAIDSFESALSMDPSNSACANKLSEARARHLIDLRAWQPLQELAQTLTNAHPARPLGWFALARALYEQARIRDAMRAYRRVVDLRPDSAETWAAHGRLCLEALELDAAAESLGRAERLAPEAPETLVAKGLLLTYRGRLADARACVERALARRPDYVPAYTLLCRLTQGELSDRTMRELQRARDREGQAAEDKISADFALGDAHDALGDIDAAMAAYGRAHARNLDLSRAERLVYDPTETRARTDRILESFANVKPANPVARSGLRPIFVVGMPRSGTTLVESLLAAHSKVVAGGERPAMPQLLADFLAASRSRHDYEPSSVLCDDWRRRYLDDSPRANAPFAIDKNPLNFEAVGLIAKLFPESRIVHIRRNPIETGLSIYRHEFKRGWTFAHRLEDIGHFYGEYARLVDHWARVLGDRFFTIQYEQLASDFATEARRVVAACGLDWEDACLAFQTVDRAIATLSAVQARDPVSVRNGRARRYGERLAPLVAALEAANVDLETGALRGNRSFAAKLTEQLVRRRTPAKKKAD